MNRDKLTAFTERAIRATDLREQINPIVYLPSRLRAHQQRLTIDQIRVTVDPPTVAENMIRIKEADPLGFLIALVNGQPIPTFTITAEGSIMVKYEVANLHTRERIAMWMANKVTIKQNEAEPRTRMANQPQPDEWDAIVESRNAKGND